jgi:hypothetical protein
VKGNTYCLISNVRVFERTFKGMYLHIILVQGNILIMEKQWEIPSVIRYMLSDLEYIFMISNDRVCVCESQFIS